MWIKLFWLEIELEPEELSEISRHLALLAAFSTLLRLLVLYSNRPDFLQYLPQHYKMSKQMDSKQAQRLLKSLESDPRLQAPDDATILSDEQYPVAFDAAILRLKDPISVISAVTILGWNRDIKDQRLSTHDRDRLIKQQDTVRSTLLLTPTSDNPMDEISFQHWKHRITNICLDAAQVALQTVDDNTSLKYLFQPSATSTSTVRRADTRNIQGLVLYHPIILDSPWSSPPNIDNKIVELIRERDPLLLARAYPDLSQVWDAHEHDRLYEASIVAMRTITTLQESIKVLLQRIYKSHFSCVTKGDNP